MLERRKKNAQRIAGVFVYFRSSNNADNPFADTILPLLAVVSMFRGDAIYLISKDEKERS